MNSYPRGPYPEVSVISEKRKHWSSLDLGQFSHTPQIPKTLFASVIVLQFYVIMGTYKYL